jgi:hypothetical protein
MTPEQRKEWEAEVRSLYDGMVRDRRETWANLIGFETTSRARLRSWSGNGTNVSAAERLGVSGLESGLPAKRRCGKAPDQIRSGVSANVRQVAATDDVGRPPKPTRILVLGQ